MSQLTCPGRLLRGALLAGVAAAAALTPVSARQTAVRIAELPPLSGDQRSYAFDISQHGEAVGASEAADAEGNILRTGPVYWRRNQVVALPLPEGSAYGAAYGVNDRSQFVGESGPDAAHARATVWQKGVASVLPGLGDSEPSYGSDINNRGQIGGSARTADGHWRALLWQSGRIVKQYDPLPGDTDVVWNVINAKGHGAGSSFSLDAEGNPTGYHAVLFRNGVTVALPVPEGFTSSHGFCLNDRDQVVGPGRDAEGRQHGLVWTGSRVRDLGIPAGAIGSTADAINNRGEIVGTQTLSETEFLTVLWTKKGAQPLNDRLNTEGWTNLGPWILNDRGQLVGPGTLNGASRGFIARIPRAKKK